MSVVITSTTDSNEAVIAATGSLAQKQESKIEENKSESNSNKNELDETSDDSDSSAEDLDLIKDDDNQDDTEENDEAPKTSKKKGGFKKRIERFQKQLSAKDQEIEYLKSLALKNQSPPSKPDEKAESIQAIDNSKKPKAENYDSHEEYVEALTDWKYEQREIQKSAKQKEDQIKSDYEKQVGSFQSKIAEFEKSAPDFKEVISDVDDVLMTPAVQEAILTSDLGPELIYELAKNRDEFERINSLSPFLAAREIGKFEAKLLKSSDSSKQTKEIKTTKASAPLKPVGSNSKVTIEKSPDEMDFQEYKKWREKQLQNRG